MVKNLPAGRSQSQVGIKSDQCTVWEKETRNRNKVLKMGPGGLKTSRIKSPVPRSHNTFI